MNIYINLTQHSVTEEQKIAGAFEPTISKETVTELLTFNELPSDRELQQRARALAALAQEECGKKMRELHYNSNIYIYVIIGGAPYFMSHVENAFKERGVNYAYAFSKRESVEEMLPNGTVKKTSVFRHAGWLDKRV